MIKDTIAGRFAAILLVAIVMTAVGSGESETSNLAATSRRLAELSERVRQLELELAVHQIDSHAYRSTQLEEQLGSAVSGRRRTEIEQAGTNSELLNIATQLSRSDLQQDERTELETLQNRLLTEVPQQLYAEQVSVGQRESALRKQLEHEQALTLELQRRVALLQSEASTVPAAAQHR